MLLITLVCVTFSQFTFSQEIDSVKILPSSPAINDSVYFAVYSDGFSGDCSFTIELDSINESNVYVSGTYDSNGKCGTSRGVEDSLNIGVFPQGHYNVYFSFIDIHGVFETDEFALDFTVHQPTALNDFVKKDGYTIFPNPCNSYVTVKNESAFADIRNIQLLNASGRTVVKKQVNNSETEIRIDMSSLQKGMYYLLVDDEQVGTKILKE